MRAWLAIGLTVALTAFGLRAAAAPRLEIRAAAAHVVIIPEARNDIAVSVIRGSRPLPLRILRTGETTIVDGALAHRIRGCPMLGQEPGVRIRGLGNVDGSRLPSLVVRMPRDVRVVAGDAVSGSIGRAVNIDLINRGCGAWTVANASGRVRFTQVGSGENRIGRSGTADLNVDGDGSIAVRAVAGPLTAVSSGEGAITAESLGGQLVARVAGSGGVLVLSGRAPQVNLSVAGSGAVRFGGQAGAVNASVTGPGHISIAHATGPVSRQVFGAGEIDVGH
jgi:hypothetical protein